MKVVPFTKYFWLASLSVFLGSGVALAQTATWIGAASGGEWNTAGNWSSGRPPGAATNVLIGAGTNVSYNLPMTAASFAVLTNNGVLNVNTNGFNTAGILMLNPGGTGKLLVNSGAALNVAGNLAFCSNSMATLSAGGTLKIAGSLLIGCGATGGTTGSTPGSSGIMVNNGGALNAASTSLNPGNGSVTTSALLTINGGTNNLGLVSIKRSSGTASFNAIGTEGVVINGGVVTMTNANVGGSGGNSFLSMVITGGTVTNIGTVSINQVTANRGSRLLQTGGLFVVPDPGIINPNPAVATSLNIYAVTGGTNIVGGLRLGTATSPGTVFFTNSAVIYVGSQGISSNGVVLLTMSLNDGGVFGATADWTGSAAMNLNSGTFTFSPADPGGIGHTITLSGALTGNGGLLVTNGGRLVLAGNNTYSGNTTVGMGALVLGNAGALPVGGALTLGGNGVAGTVDLAGFNPQLSSLATAGTAASQTITNSGSNISTLTFSNSGASSTFGGIIAGGNNPIGLTVLGGSLTLSGVNVYGGNIFISNGRLGLSGSGSTFTGGALVLSNPAAILDLTGMNNLSLGGGQMLAGYGVITGSVSAANCQITPGTNGGGGTLTISSNLTLNGGVTSQFDLHFSQIDPGNDQIIAGGALNLGGLNTVVINPLDGTLGVGTYHLITSSFVGSGTAANFQLTGAPGSGLQAVINVTANEVDLVVSQISENLVWAGDGGANLWDLATTNWLDLSTPVAFENGSLAIFNDAATNKTVNLTGALQPASVIVNAAGNYVFAGAGKITGTVTFSKTNSGTLTILTTNDYNGVTAIAQGTLQVGNGVASGSLGNSSIVDNGQLVMQEPNNSILSSVISGAGSLTQAGSATLTLSGANSYSGGTAISGGTLQIGTGGNLGGGNVADNSLLVFNSSSVNTVGSIISGSGSLLLSGSGQVVLAGNNSYSGGTIISNGVLLVNNSTGSGTGSGGVTNSGGTLGGTGAIAGQVVINSGATFAPGNPIGTLSIGGNFTANSGAIMNYALGASSARTAVGGNLRLNGTLNVSNAGGLTNGTYTLFTYGGSLSGTLAIGTTPPGKAYSIDTSIAGQVNLIATNLPGIGNGPAVTVTDNGNTVTLSNGVVSIVITKADAHISTMNYNGLNVLAGGSSGGEFYWSWNMPNFQNPANCVYTLVQDPASNNGTVAEVEMFSQWNGSTSTAALDVDIHYFLVQGSQGFYASSIISHPASYPDNPGGEFRMVGYLSTLMNWLSVDAQRNRLMPPASTPSVAVTGAPKEFQLWTAGIQEGQYDCKYGYSADYGDENAWGWSSTITNIGVWMTIPSREYYSGGPMKRELMCHDDQGGVGPVLLQMINGTHYMLGSDTDIQAGETFSKTFGPWLIYANSVPQGTTNAPAALFADAQAKAVAEQSVWPYPWWTNAAYVPKSGRGIVTGTVNISDSGNPNASPAGLWVGVAQTPLSTTGITDFQRWEKNLQFWTKSDANGNFVISNVVAGANYNLYAFGPGAIGQMEFDNLLNITAGQTNNVGTVTWTPSGTAARVGSTVWEIGIPDRSAHEFLHGTGDETTGFWYGDIGSSPTNPSPNWLKYMDYPTDYPGGLIYTVGQSQWATGWDYAETAVSASSATWKVFFNLPQAPTNGAQASLYIGFAADWNGPVVVTVNGTTVTSTSGISPPSHGDDSMIRIGIHGVFSDVRINFAGSNLHAGQNEIDFKMPNGNNAENGIMYDYLRLELAGYIPGTPSALTATPGNAQVALNWTAMTGATSYIIRRANSSNGTYTVIAANATGPTVGSGTTNGTYLDTTVTNGSTYYYEIAAVNPTGASSNSLPVSANLLIPIPPQIGSVRISNGSLVFGGSNGSFNGKYYVLTSTNVALPLPQWTRIATNFFDGSGNFSVTNGVGVGVPQNFYLIETP